MLAALDSPAESTPETRSAGAARPTCPYGLARFSTSHPQRRVHEVKKEPGMGRESERREGGGEDESRSGIEEGQERGKEMRRGRKREGRKGRKHERQGVRGGRRTGNSSKENEGRPGTDDKAKAPGKRQVPAVCGSGQPYGARTPRGAAICQRVFGVIIRASRCWQDAPCAGPPCPARAIQRKRQVTVDRPPLPSQAGAWLGAPNTAERSPPAPAARSLAHPVNPQGV